MESKNILSDLLGTKVKIENPAEGVFGTIRGLYIRHEVPWAIILTDEGVFQEWPVNRLRAQTRWYWVKIEFPPARKIAAIKCIRELTYADLKTAKDVAEGDCCVKRNVNLEEAEDLKKAIEVSGFVARILPMEK